MYLPHTKASSTCVLSHFRSCVLIVYIRLYYEMFTFLHTEHGVSCWMAVQFCLLTLRLLICKFCFKFSNETQVVVILEIQRTVDFKNICYCVKIYNKQVGGFVIKTWWKPDYTLNVLLNPFSTLILLMASLYMFHTVLGRHSSTP